uniref:Uncharacterized protein n=1 Tax=Chromera velia CCMP2878 TaxID=1169474 RepID=A0A0G4HKZ9_9ALVE|eukprot:Cvel_28612.t1-p1 / transcript=Cvel_28612.t1 / gene=Cvel_28612 / organism=Chromera_velia_CCMP2878 / gene_product=hypothetical protein / transcript_product=hypothetical protein / location=Cvel_scaffold3775:4755-5099(+) / protein_length=115 / sequence_SO=supercontig / SO=protein_coding / is_pseudo=false
MIKEWYRTVLQKGLATGYFPEPDKTIPAVPAQFVEEAKRVFAQFLPKEEGEISKEMTIVTGCRLLGGFMGDETKKEKWVGKKVEEFVKRMERVAEAAVHAPQEAYTAYVKSQQRE